VWGGRSSERAGGHRLRRASRAASQADGERRRGQGNNGRRGRETEAERGHRAAARGALQHGEICGGDGVARVCLARARRTAGPARPGRRPRGAPRSRGAGWCQTRRGRGGRPTPCARMSGRIWGMS
jgi:hypothetical protein